MVSVRRTQIGYQEARLEDSRFILRGEQQAEALERLLELSKERFGYDLADRELADVDSFLRLFAFETVRDGDDIIALTFEDRLLLEIEDVFSTLAAFVEPGSFLQLHAGSGARWRYDFDGSQMTTTDLERRPWYGR